MKPDGMTQAVYERYQTDGFTEADIERIWQETLSTRARMAARQGKEARDVTSSTYERAQKRLNRQVSDWLGIREGKR